MQSLKIQLGPLILSYLIPAALRVIQCTFGQLGGILSSCSCGQTFGIFPLGIYFSSGDGKRRPRDGREGSELFFTRKLCVGKIDLWKGYPGQGRKWG